MAGARAIFGLKDVDKGWKSLVLHAERLKREKGMYVKAGMLGVKAAEEHPDEEGGSLTNVELLAIHEFGVPPKIPERSVIRASWDLHARAYYRQLRALVGHWFDTRGKMPMAQALGIMGLKMRRDQQARVLEGAGVPPPNAPSTIARKLRKGKWKGKTAEQQQEGIEAGKGPRPLVESGRMVGALSHEVVTGLEGAKP